jgi:hypothetical protein
VVVVVGLTVTATPLVAARLPGVMTPVPFAKTPVRAALAPSAMEVGFAVKLLIDGGGGVSVLADPVPQAVKPAKPSPRVMASGVRTRRRFMDTPFPGQERFSQERSLCNGPFANQRLSAGHAQRVPFGEKVSKDGDFTKGLFRRVLSVKAWGC